MPVIFAANTPADFGFTQENVILETNAARHSPLTSRGTLLPSTSSSNNILGTIWPIPVELRPIREIWMSYYLFKYSAGGPYYMALETDSTSNIIHHYATTGGTAGIRRGSTTLAAFPSPSALRFRYDIQFKFDDMSDTNGVINAYVDKVLAATYTGTISPTGNDPALIRFHNGSNVDAAISGVIIATDSTLARDYVEIDLSAGSQSQWTGNSANAVNGLIEPLPALAAAAPDLTQTFAQSPAASFPAGSDVESAIFTSIALQGADGENGIQHVGRFGSTNLDIGGTHPLTENIRVLQTISAVNPNTGVAWTESDLSTMQSGFTSRDLSL